MPGWADWLLSGVIAGTAGMPVPVVGEVDAGVWLAISCARASSSLRRVGGTSGTSTGQRAGASAPALQPASSLAPASGRVRPSECDQRVHRGLRAHVGQSLIEAGVGERPLRRVDLVLGVQQIEQAALSHRILELLAIGGTRIGDGGGVALEVADLLGQTARVVEGDHCRLPLVAAGVVTQVGGLVDQVHLLAHARLIGKAVEEIPAHHELGGRHAVLVGDGVDVPATTSAQPGLHARLECSLADAHGCPGGTHLLDAGADGGALPDRDVGCLGGVVRHRLLQQGRQRQAGRRRFADDALIAGRDIVQIRQFGCEVRLGQGKAGTRLLEVHTRG